MEDIRVLPAQICHSPKITISTLRLTILLPAKPNEIMKFNHESFFTI
jgi:hypothetical protein